MTTAEIPRRSYITTAAFHQDIFAYTTSYNPATFTTTGTLTSLSTAGTGTAANCPANRVLRENGKKLFPPGLVVSNNTTYAAPNPGVTTYMVGVYDPITFLSGFIDPNSKLFAIYNTDKPDYVPRGINPNGNTEVDEGAPVYTLGSVKAGTTITAGTTVTAGTGGFIMPTATVAATGTNAATAAQLAAGFSLVTGADDTVCVILPTAVAGTTCYVRNNVSAKTLPVYPGSGVTINALTAGNPFNINPSDVANLTATIFIATSATQWYTITSPSASITA